MTIHQMPNLSTTSTCHRAPWEVFRPAPAADPDAVDAPQPQPRSGTVIVGVDGSGAARHAAHWAADEADQRRSSLQLVHAHRLPGTGANGHNPYEPGQLAELNEVGDAILHDTAAELRLHHPALPISTHLAYGSPASVLREASELAQLTVVGARHESSIATALVAVAAAVAVNCPVPVGVIHTDATPAGPVVVGVDGSPSGDAAMRYAFDAAKRRGADLVAVHCWADRAIDGPFPAFLTPADAQAIEDEQRSLLARFIRFWAHLYPTVSAREDLVHDYPSRELLRYSRIAQLMVIGSRGHGLISGLLVPLDLHPPARRRSQVHALIGMALFALWPFTRLVHAFSAPIGYLFRPYIVYRSRAAARPGETIASRPRRRSW